MPFASLVALTIHAHTPKVQIDDLPRRGVLGVGFSPLPAEKATELNIPAGIGAVAAQPVPGLTAAVAGFKPGDILIAINGKPVAISAIGSTIRELPSGKEATFEVMRDGTKQVLELRVELGLGFT
ncbi:MAG TPA: PDZ domain-containing protein, partial [Fimbriimonas sp.]|nr:PDZ domain-containing protein [Fimbriimonas sp.]